ncbi:MAG TPA: TIGR02757 family protein [bacterium]|nr:TIGR02757 family protein [bacterium]
MGAKLSNKAKPANKRKDEARRILGDIAKTYDSAFVDGDPVRFVHHFESREDREVVALLSALLAFGNVKSIHASVAKVLEIAGPSPSEFARAFDADALAPRFAALGHRWVRGADLVKLFDVMRYLILRFGSLQEAFLAHHRPSDPHVGPMLERFSLDVFSRLHKPALSRGFRYFFPSPADGSPCKRLCMFLRWMARPADGIDLGLWPGLSASKLVIPLDTHVYRFARRFRLSPYKNPRWDVAVHVTEFLKEIEPSDPVRFDFSICHYGMDVGW